MISRESKDSWVGIIVFIIIAALFNLVLKVDIVLSVIIAAIVGVVSAFIADKLQRGV